MDNVFVDTSLFKALIDRKDEFHIPAKSIWDKQLVGQRKLLTTNFVLDESFTLIRVRTGIEKLFEFREFLMDGVEDLKIIRVMAGDEIKAWEWMGQGWSKLSFTDCTSFAVMKRIELTDVVTFDDHFAKAGFNILQP